MLKDSGKQYCGDPAALVSYLYNDGTPEELALIAAHVQDCDSCTRELASLGDTRERLAAWSPPPAELGFTIGTVPASDVTPQPVLLTPDPVAAATPWWRQSAPVWMQAVAASALFAAGLAVGTSGRSAAPAPVATSATATPVSRGELADLEQRLRAELTKLSSTPAAAPAPVQTARVDDGAHDAALMRQIKSLLSDSEERQRRELALRTAQVMRDLEIQRKVDMATVQQNIGQLQGATGAELRQQRDLYNQLMNNVGLRSPAR